MAGALKVDTIQNGSGGTFDWAASGATTFPAGTALLPGITTTGDTNTGIFFPAADTIAFSEGGAEAMRIDSSSNVGIGVTPSAWSGFRALQIGGTTSLWSSTNTNYQGSFYTNNGYYNGTNRIYLTNGYAAEYIQGFGLHHWFTAPSGTVGNAITFTEAMRLDTSGNLLFNSGYGSVATAYGCRAWVNFIGNGTVSIRASGNVSSITDRGVGLYTVNFTTAMPDANYCYQMCARDSDEPMGIPTVQADPAAAQSPTTTTLPIVYNYPGNAAFYDAGTITVAIFR